MEKGKMFAGLFVAIGIIVLGVLLNVAIKNFKAADRDVTVRGLSEMEVDADQVLWPVVYNITGNELQSIYSTIESNNKIVTDFLTSNLIKADEITTSAPQIVDLNADRYNDNRKGFRYLVTQVITVNSRDVKKVIELQSRQSELLKRGIAISADSYQYQTQFLFTGLNDVKPSMIEDATKNARASAEKFAEDSGSELGNIKSAYQGQLTIEDRDVYTPQVKKLRVVTTVVYSLKD